MASTTATLSLDAKTTGNGTVVDFATAKKNVSAVYFPTGLVTSGVVLIQASQDSLNWVDIASLEGSTRVRSIDINRGAYRYWRATVADSIRGGSASVTFMESD